MSASLQNVDLVIEGTGVFVNSEGAGKHLQAGAKKVLLQLSFNPCIIITGRILGVEACWLFQMTWRVAQCP